MPIFEYKCEKCEKVFEEILSFSASEKKQTCPYCKGTETKKLLSSFASFSGGEKSFDTGSAGSGAGHTCYPSGGG